MRAMTLLLTVAALWGVDPTLWADNCKIPIVPPACVDEGKGQGEIAANQGNPNGDGKKPDNVAGNSGDGNIDPTDPSLKPVDADVQTLASSRGYFSEPSQTAVIAWNGAEQIMVLTTHEESRIGKGAMLSFMPLPGEPIDIRAGDKRLFDKAYKLVEAKLKREVPGLVGRNEVTLERKIGSHNIFVWRIDNINEFQDKIQSYVFKKYSGQGKVLFNKKTLDMVKDYFGKGFKYFAFDLTFVSDTLSEKMPIEYHFKAKFVYYPLVISSGTGTGETKIELVVLTNSQGVNQQLSKLKFANDDNENGDIMTLGKKSVTLSNEEVNDLHPGMAKLMAGQDVRARIWVVRGRMESFPGDIMAYFKQ
jgi:hypothetical protein